MSRLRALRPKKAAPLTRKGSHAWPASLMLRTVTGQLRSFGRERLGFSPYPNRAMRGQSATRAANKARNREINRRRPGSTLLEIGPTVPTDRRPPGSPSHRPVHVSRNQSPVVGQKDWAWPALASGILRRTELSPPIRRQGQPGTENGPPFSRPPQN